MNILALDLGKYKTVFCEYDSENGKHDFGKINTTPQDSMSIVNMLLTTENDMRTNSLIVSFSGFCDK